MYTIDMKTTKTAKTPKKAIRKLSSKQFAKLAAEFQNTKSEKRAAELKKALVNHFLHLND